MLRPSEEKFPEAHWGPGVGGVAVLEQNHSKRAVC